MRLLKKINLAQLVSALFTLLLGIIFICFQTKALTTINYVLGGFIIAIGIAGIINYFIYGFEPFGFINGVIKIFLGLMIIVFADTLASPSVFSIVVGSIMFVSSLFKIQSSIDAKHIGLKSWWIYMIYSALLMVFGVLLLINPFSGTKIFMIVSGIFFVVSAVCDIVSMIIVNGKLRKIKKDISNTISQYYIINE